MSSLEHRTVIINGKSTTVAATTTVASALLAAGVTSFKKSVSGEPRGPVCGMGICYGCTAVIDDVVHERTCQTLCRNGMNIRTQQ